MGNLEADDAIDGIVQELPVDKDKITDYCLRSLGGIMETGEWLRDHLREFADRLEQSVVERERERAAIICHNFRDWQDNPAEAIATAILKGE